MNTRLTFICDEPGMRLDRFLGKQPEIASRSAAQRLIQEGAVQQNGAPQPDASRRLQLQDEIVVELPEPEELQVLPEAGDLEVLHEDAALIVVNKPAGMVTHPAPGHASGTLVNYLLHHCQDLTGVGGYLRPGIVHRIDKDTSGILVVAKNDLAHQSLSEQFRAHSVKRQYQAIVWGRFADDQGVVDAPLGRHPVRRKEVAVQERGRRAVTHWRVTERFSQLTRLACRLETGRTHQIRVHLTHLGHPLLGDPQYGRSPLNRLSGLSPRLRQALADFPRQALHAELLGFRHPVSGKPMTFKTRLPEDLQALLELLRKEAPAPLS